MPRFRVPGVVATLVVATSAILFCFRPLTPAMPQGGLDASWVVVMGEAAERHLQWGTDLAFPYGPAASLMTVYGGSHYLSHILPVILMLGLLFGWGVTLLIGAGQRSRRGIPALAALTMAVAVAGTRGFPDVLFALLPLLPFLLVLDGARPSGPRTAVTAALALAVGITAMAKLTFLMIGLPLFVVADSVTLIRRRLPVLVPLFAAGFAAAGWSFDQNLATLSSALPMEWQVVAGYGEGMALDGSHRELAAFILSCSLLLGLALRAEIRAVRLDGSSYGSGLVRLAGLALVLFMLFKAGFVRQDLHTLIAWNGLALAAVIAVWARFRHWARWSAGAILAAAMATVLLICPTLTITQAPADERVAAADGLYRTWLLDEPRAQLAAAVAALADPSGFARDLAETKTAAWARIVDRSPLPKLGGRVDIIPSLQSAVIANGLDYAPRPSFQEYATYTAALADANRRFIEGPLAPEWILFGPEPNGLGLTIDARYPNFAEGALWPDLLRLYRPDRRIDTLLALRRRPAAADVTFDSRRRTTVAFNQTVDVTDASATFARIVVHPNLLGRIAALLFRSAPLVITVHFADGTRRTFQFITGLGEAGFLLSPLVTDAAEFQDLAEGATALPDRIVAGFSIDAPRKLQAFYAPEIAVETTAIHVVSAPEGSSAAAAP